MDWPGWPCDDHMADGTGPVPITHKIDYRVMRLRMGVNPGWGGEPIVLWHFAWFEWPPPGGAGVCVRIAGPVTRARELSPVAGG